MATSTVASNDAGPAQSANMSRRQATMDFDMTSQDEMFSSIPVAVRTGTTMQKVSPKKTQKRLVKLKAEAGQLIWESKHAGMLNIESIRELRFAGDAAGYAKVLHCEIPDAQSRWITIIYTSAEKFKILHLIAPSHASFEEWRLTLQTLFDQRKELMGGLDQMRKRQAIWLKQHWSTADINGDEKLDVSDVIGLCRNLNITASEKSIAANFKAADSRQRGWLDFQDFQTFVKRLRRRPELEALMTRIVGNDTDHIPSTAFIKFLRETQCVSSQQLSDELALALYAKFSDQLRSPQATSFTAFLQSSDNMAMSERQTRVCDDMTRPLCEYYISSSHNTYLVGGQLKGESTSEGYIRALQRGCRSVELDIWDGPTEPVVYHGRTLTSKLSAREALTAIAKYAFVASPYPVILSIEVHCGHAQQDMLAEILRSSLGTALLDEPLFGEERLAAHAQCPEVDRLPSPEDLKYRILVKAKNLYVVKAALDAKVADEELQMVSESSSTSSDSDLRKAFGAAMRIIRPKSHRTTGSTTSIPSPRLAPPRESDEASALNESQIAMPAGAPPTQFGVPLTRQTSNPTQNDRESPAKQESSAPRRLSLQRLRSRSSSRSSNGAMTSAVAEEAVIPKAKEKPLMSFALASVIVYTVGVKWRGFNKKEHYSPSHVISLGEKRAIRVIKDARQDLIVHDRTHILRTYPAGLRFTSSNYSPLSFWAAGVQLVSLNWQTCDLGMELNAAMFQRNGRCGYVLKPEFLRVKKSDAKDKEVLGRTDRYSLVCEILSAQQLPRPREALPEDSPSILEEAQSFLSAKERPSIALNPFVEAAVHTPPTGNSSVSDSPLRYRTSIVYGNGFNPVFENSRFVIPFKVPADMLDLAFLRLECMVRLGGDEVPLGRCTMSLPVLQPGYRHVPLYDHLGHQYLFSSLLIYTKLSKVA